MRKPIQPFFLWLIPLMLLVCANAFGQGSPNSINPENGAINVSLTPSITYTWTATSIDVSPLPSISQVYLREHNGTVNIAPISYNFNGKQITITPVLGTGENANQLKPNTQYSLYATAYYESTGNAIAVTNFGDYWQPSNNVLNSFTTGGDFTLPTLSKYLPAIGATGLGTTVSFALTLDEKVVAGTGNIEIRRFSDDQVTASLDVSTLTYTHTSSLLPKTTVSFDASGLATDTQYYVHIPSGAFEDVSGNAFAGLTDKSYDFTTSVGDQIAPYLLSSNPVNGAFNARPFAISLVYNEFLTAGSGTAYVKKASDNSIVYSFTAAELSWPEPSAELSLNISPIEVFIGGETYYVEIPAGFLEDAAGNPVSAIGPNELSFEWAIIPDVIATNPTDGATGVSPNISSLYVDYSENVFFDAGGSTAYKFQLQTSAGALIKEFNSATEVSVSDNRLTLTGIPALSDNTSYKIRLNGNQQSFKDSDGNQIPPFLDGDWDFTTGVADVTSPAVSSRTPADNATDVSVAIETLNLTYNEPIKIRENVGVINVDYFLHLAKFDNTIVKTFDLTTADVEVNGNTLILKNFGTLEYNTSYYVYYLAYTNTAPILDLAGNVAPAFNNASSWNFTTEGPPNNAPTDISLSASAIDENNAVDALVATLSTTDADEGNTFTYSLVSGAGSTDNASFTINGSELRANASFDFETKNSYAIRIRSTDQGTLLFEKEFTISINDVFEDVSAPVVNSTYPTIGGTYADLGGACNIIFNEDIQLGNGSFTLYKADDTLVETVPVGTGDQRVTLAASNRVSVIFDVNYEPITQYYIVVTDGAVQDLSGNNFAGYAAGEWHFTSNSVPLVETLSPADNVTGVSINATLSIVFDQRVYGYDYANANSNVYLYKYDTDELLMTINTADMSFVDSLVTIPLPSALPNATHVYVLDDSEGTFESDNSELFPGFSSKDDWDFTTEKLTQSITFEALPAKTYGDASFELTATASSGLAVSYTSSNESVATISGNVLTIMGAGTATITASQAGDDNYEAAAPVEQVLTVNKASQNITFGAISSKTYGDAAFNPGATASSGLAISYTSSNEAVATISGTTLTITGAGTATITASQAGDANYEAATSVEQVLTVNKANQTITTESIADKSISDAPFEVQASTTSGLTLSYAILSGPASIQGNVITLNGNSGTVQVEVSQAGNENYLSASAQTSFAVIDDSKTDQSITFNALENKTYGDAAFELTATASSELEVSYTSSNPAVASISGTTVSITGAGTATITATQTGDETFNPAPAVSQTLTVNPANLTVIVDDQSMTYGEAIPTFTYQISGFVNGEEASVLLQNPQVSSTATEGSDAGTYEITASGAEAANYAIGYETGTLTINKASQTVSITAIAQQSIEAGTLTLEATASSGLEISFAVLSGPATVAGNQLTLNGTPGTVVVEASQAGNQNYEAASAQTSFTVINPNNPCEGFAVSVSSQTDNLCAGEANGTITVAVSGGTEPYTFSWNNGASSQNITGLAAGDYTLTVTDANACTVSLSASISEPTVLEATFIAQSQTDGETPNGSIDLSVSGGTAPYTYAWSNEFSAEDQSNLVAGEYSVTVTDANGCTVQLSITVADEIEVISGLADKSFGIKVYPNPASGYVYLASEKAGAGEIWLMNLHGQVVQKHRTESLQSFRMDISGLRAGTYLLRIDRGAEAQVLKIQVE